MDSENSLIDLKWCNNMMSEHRNSMELKSLDMLSPVDLVSLIFEFLPVKCVPHHQSFPFLKSSPETTHIPYGLTD